MFLRLRSLATAPCRKSALRSTFQMAKRFMGVRHKVVDIDDAVAVVRNRDTLCVSGFVTQSTPETLLRALGERYKETQEPRELRLLFGGGPGDYATKGLNHLSPPGMLRTTIGGHYGQVPQLAQLVLENQVAGYALPMGSISRMIRAAASHSPGHITKVGLGSFVDPRQTGGALNDLARANPLVELLHLDNEEYLRYPSIPINVALIRATTADPDGNLTMEHESILGDAKQIAMATRSSGGIVIAQVERVAAHGSLPAREVDIPAPFVDCVVVGEPEEHTMSFITNSNPYWTGEIRQPMDDLPTMQMGPRKIIARRAAMELQQDDVVNLGIGMPDGVASVAFEEGIFPYMTLTTEAGVIGGVGAPGHDFGPASNPDSFNEMNQQFDLYNGGGLSVCFLGLAQCASNGNVNVSRLTEDRLTGPGGFIDIAQCTRRVVFMGTFMKKGLKIGFDPEGCISIENEGEVPTFQEDVREITFAAQQALASGQQVLYITERCVFELSSNGLELKEIAPGIDLEKDILAHMECQPYIEDRHNIPLMDKRIFQQENMGLYDDMFSMEKQSKKWFEYAPDVHTFFMNFHNLVIRNKEEIDRMESLLSRELQNCMDAAGGKKVNVVVNYDGFDCSNRLTDQWEKMAKRHQSKYYASVKRLSGKMFLRQRLHNHLEMESAGADATESFAQIRKEAHDMHPVEEEVQPQPTPVVTQPPPRQRLWEDTSKKSPKQQKILKQMPIIQRESVGNSHNIRPQN